MNTRHYYLRLLRTLALAALTAAATAACSDDNGDPDGREPITPDDANPGIAVNFTANINPGSDADPAAAPGTRTVLKPDGRNGFTVEWKGKDTYSYNCDQIFIWAAMGNTLANNGNYKIYFPTTSDVSSALEPYYDGPLTLTDSGEWKFTATYGSTIMNGAPYVALGYQTQSAPDNTDHIAEEDFSVATTTQTVEAGDMPQIGLQFKHQLSALQLQVKNETGAELTVEEIRLSVTGDQIVYQRSYDLATEDWKADGEYKSDYLQLTITTPAALPSGGTESQDFHMLLFPEPGHSRTNMTVTVITSRGEYSRTRPAPDGGFAAGKNYLTDITIKTSGLDPDTETWTETISNKAELAAFRERVNGGNKYDGATIRLTADIDLTGETWTPIGNAGGRFFSGTFDGGGHLISKLTVDNGSTNYAGLFGYVRGKVSNLRVSGTVTTTGYYAGGIAGSLSGNSTVENCIFSGDVSGASFVGGIAGFNSGSTITGCYTKGSVTATDSGAGGIAGDNSGTITACYSEATVTGKAGGIAGLSGGSGNSISHCYATGSVSGIRSTGGIMGDFTRGSVENCIALNPALTRTSGSSNTSFGRIAGNLGISITLTSCSAFEGMTIKDDAGGTDIYADATGKHGTALTAAQCLTTATYTDLGFTAADAATTSGWAFDSGATWTYLPWNKAFESFPGISETDYRISVPAHLNGGGTN